MTYAFGVHNLTVQSFDDEASNFPDGEKLTLVTGAFRIYNLNTI